MSELDILQTDPQSRKKLAQLTHIPVEHEYRDRLLAILEAHGARTTPTKTTEYTRKFLDGKRVTRPYSEYTIDFPEETFWEYGTFFYRSVPYTIFFPDGYKLYCTQVFAPRDAGKALTILHIPAR